MLFSILTPCYNSAKFIESTVNSFLSQNFADGELILLNDGSGDNTLEVITDLARRDPRIRVIDQKNSGVSVSRNHLIDEARGEWILFLDHDDQFLPDASTELRGLINSFPDAECFVFPCCLKDENGGVVQHIAPVFRDFGNQLFSGAEAFRWLYSEKKYRGQHWHPWRFVFRRECRPYFTPGVIHEDLDALPLYIAGLHSVCIAKVPYYLYTMDSPDAVTRSFSPKRVADICEVTSRLYEKMAQISSKQSCLQLPDEVLRGFKAMLAFNIFGYYQAVVLFPEPQRSQLLAFFESRKDWLLAIENPTFNSSLKVLCLRVLGVKKSARFFLYMNNIKNFFKRIFYR